MAHCSLQMTVDFDLLDVLADPPPSAAAKGQLPRRDAALDPLLIAAAAASGPHVTRNHYHHNFYPNPDGTFDWANALAEGRKHVPVSRQAPRRQRLLLESKENEAEPTPLAPADNLPSKKRRPSSPVAANAPDSRSRSKSVTAQDLPTPTKALPRLQVKCMARTRIPTPHGPAFLHLYHNNRDNKEHLAVVVDPAQLESTAPLAPPIRSQSLDAVWTDNETEMDRIIRGAYVGRLSDKHQRAFDPSSPKPVPPPDLPPPLIRIHSECFTGETIGSQRCDCGEQLDEAIKRISQPISLPSTSTREAPVTLPGRGAVIYLRQEGRGIGLLSKIRAYNLQDLGHDTVTANLMLGHKADERGYEIAAAILKDLGLGACTGDSVRILTNNPDKMEALRKEGINISERVAMIPRKYQTREQDTSDATTRESAGLTLIGGQATDGEDLDKYLRTKVVRMGHMLPLWLEENM